MSCDDEGKEGGGGVWGSEKGDGYTRQCLEIEIDKRAHGKRKVGVPGEKAIHFVGGEGRNRERGASDARGRMRRRKLTW